MKNIRVYIEKQEQYDIHSQSLRNRIRHIYSPSHLRLYLVYDIFGIDEAGLSHLLQHIIADPRTDIVHLQQPPADTHIAWEYLNGQYDQRGEAAEQCFALLGFPSTPSIHSGYFLALSADATPHIEALTAYLVNPVDSHLKDLRQLSRQTNATIHPIASLDGFTRLPIEGLQAVIKGHALSIDIEDILLIQRYFQSERREPTIAEIKIIDTYWSDHCRHTTFLTHIEGLEIRSTFEAHISRAWQRYLSLKKEIGQEERHISLMDMATIVAKYFKRQHLLQRLDESEEINACSVKVAIQLPNGEQENWLLMFKNETHNHPTEIDPFGGASTCIGGAIRDPLSGRAYVYQAMRVSGAGNPLDTNTLPNKLPQQKICIEAAVGFSSYGNQIGVTTSHVSEIYDAGYTAKRLEVGLVVGAVPESFVRRESPSPSDVVILLGGKTGKDGIGGASGSSQSVEKEQSTQQLSAQVQKGNAPLERMLQRLFLRPEFLRCVKKSNDFGAGGVSVAIGELARGIRIDLDCVPLKYSGLNGLEIAISESQERMAIVCEQRDASEVIRLADEENILATIVAEVTDDDTLRMVWQGKEIVHLKRSFLDTNGASRSVSALYQDSVEDSPFEHKEPFSTAGYLSRLSSLQHCSQIGLINQFDSSIGKRTVLSPLGGTYQTTPEDAGVQQLPHPDTTTCSAIAYGYDPSIARWSCFHAGVYAVVASVSKLIAAGVALTDIHLSFQEYFERLDKQPEKWGKPIASLLGAMEAQLGLGIAAIGGKDSMSGTYGTLHVPPTLISFAVGVVEKTKVISSTLPSGAGQYLYLAKLATDPVSFLPDMSALLAVYRCMADVQSSGKVLATKAVGMGGLAIDLSMMAWGNRVGLRIDSEEMYTPCVGSFLVASSEPLSDQHLTLLGRTTDLPTFQFNGQDIPIALAEQHWRDTLQSIYPDLRADVTTDTTSSPTNQLKTILDISSFPSVSHRPQRKTTIATPSVCIPVFPGTNCEYDTATSFEQVGAKTTTVIFRNRTPDQIKASLRDLSQHIDRSEILCLSGGFSYADEPDGAAKYIASILRHPSIQDSIQRLLLRDGLVLGICNGFQALIKSGLLPFNGETSEVTLTHNHIGRHIARVVNVKIVSGLSPWVGSQDVQRIYRIPVSHGEGKLTLSSSTFQRLVERGQVVSQYVDEQGKASMDFPYNPNGSDFAVEGLTDPTGKIYGRMGHPERFGTHLFKNIPAMDYHNIFLNGVHYFN